jgi:dGTPase
MVGEAFADVRRRYPDISEDRMIHEAVRDMIGFMVTDVLTETRERLRAANPRSADDIRGLDHSVATFSNKFRDLETPLRSFLYENMYRHYKVNRMMGQASRIVRELFNLFIEDPTILPTEYQRNCDGALTATTARIVCDYIAGMTDTFAIAEHKKLFSVSGYL